MTAPLSVWGRHVDATSASHERLRADSEKSSDPVETKKPADLVEWCCRLSRLEHRRRKTARETKNDSKQKRGVKSRRRFSRGTVLSPGLLGSNLLRTSPSDAKRQNVPWHRLPLTVGHAAPRCAANVGSPTSLSPLWLRSGSALSVGVPETHSCSRCLAWGDKPGAQVTASDKSTKLALDTHLQHTHTNSESTASPLDLEKLALIFSFSERTKTTLRHRTRRLFIQMLPASVSSSVSTQKQKLLAEKDYCCDDRKQGAFTNRGKHLGVGFRNH